MSFIIEFITLLLTMISGWIAIAGDLGLDLGGLLGGLGL